MHVLDDSNETLVNTGHEDSSGAAHSWDGIVARNYTALYRLAWHLCGSLHEAEDLVQETFLKAFEHRADFRGEASLRTWLSRISVNTYLAKRRRARREGRMDLAGASIADWSSSPEYLVIQEEFHRCIHYILHHDCRPSERIILVLRDLDGLSYDEIAQVLGISLSAVKSRLHRARNAFRERLLQSGCAGLLEKPWCSCEGVRRI